MGIKFHCPNGHKLNVKSFLAGKRGICPHCGAKVQIPDNAVAEERALTGAGNAAVATAAVGLKAMADTATIPGMYTREGVAPATSAAVVATPATSLSAATVTATTAAAPLTAAPANALPNGAPVLSAAPTLAPAAAAATLPLGPAPETMMPATPAVAAPLSPSPYVATPVAPTTDPIAEAPNAVWYVRPPSGGQFGPARGDIMRKWLGEGRVSADSLVWRDGWADWKTAAMVFPAQFPAGHAATPAAVADPLPAAGPNSAKNASARALRAKKRSNTFAVGIVIALGLLAIVLLVVFFFVVLSGLN